MKHLMLIAALTLSNTAFATEAPKAPEKNPVQNSAPTDAAKPSSNELKVGVKGMVCAFCAQGIEKKFMAQKEIEKIQVSLENKFVKLKFKDGQKLDNKKIAEILKSAGYEADFGG